MVPHPAFDAILRETLAEVEAAEAIDASDARQAQDDVERLRLHAAQLVSEETGGPWLTGAEVRFAQQPGAGASPVSRVDIRFPAPRVPVPAHREETVGEGQQDQTGRLSQPRMVGRRPPAAAKPQP